MAGRRRAIGPRARRALGNLLGEATREDRQVVLVTTAPSGSDAAPPPLAPTRAADARAAIEAAEPKPWPVDRQAALARLAKTLAARCKRRHMA